MKILIPAILVSVVWIYTWDQVQGTGFLGGHYIGCYYYTYLLTDQDTTFTLGFDHGSVDSCIHGCVTYGYMYAGLRFSQHWICQCGYKFKDYLPNESQCKTPCRDDATQNCGGEAWMSLYKAGCPHGYWGIGYPYCQSKCGYCADDAQCELINATCPTGCEPGWKNSQCDEQDNITITIAMPASTTTTIATKTTTTTTTATTKTAIALTTTSSIKTTTPTTSPTITTSASTSTLSTYSKIVESSTTGDTFTITYGSDGSETSAMSVGANTTKSISDGQIAGIVVGCLLIILLLLAITAFILRHKIYKKIRKNTQQDVETVMTTYASSAPSSARKPLSERLPIFAAISKMLRRQNNVEEGDIYKNLVLSSRVKLENLQNVVQEQLSTELPFLEEYEKIPKVKNHPCRAAENPRQQIKNRFMDILPYDHSRVVLSTIDNDPTSDYINANYIQGYNENQKFIASQGPKANTVDDFWRMIWDENIYKIIMLTNMKENGKVKCSQYWPDEVSEIYDQVEVKMDQSQKFPDFIIRTLTASKDGVSREVKLFHFTSWPDHGVPYYVTPVLNFHKKVRFELGMLDPKSPVLIHCSAGVGRTGAFLAIDYLLQEMQEKDSIDVMSCVWAMRDSRPRMVQTRDQYEFVYRAILEAMIVGVTLIPCFEFNKVYSQMLKPLTYSNFTKVKEQYNMLESRKSKQSKYSVSEATSRENKDKNHSMDILPDDEDYTALLTEIEGRTDYINAVFVDGRDTKSKYVVTQLPLQDTIVDFWALVYDYKCPCIVNISTNMTEEVIYWPTEDSPLETGPFCVTLESESEVEETKITIREIKLFHKEKEEILPVIQVCYSGWLDEGSSGPRSQDLIQLHMLVQKKQNLSQGPILVHCVDGVEQSGVFVGVSNLIDMMSVEQELDVFHVVQTIRTNRQQFITSEEQYHYLYEVAKDYIESFNTYSNFNLLTEQSELQNEDESHVYQNTLELNLL